MAINKRNPYNEESGLFRALTKLFSGPIVKRRSQSGRQLRRRHLDIFSSRFKSASGQTFKKTEYNPMNVTTLNMISNRNRAERYVDFDQMEYTPEIASSLDIYADEMTTYSDLKPMLKIKCSNEEIKTILESLYLNVMNIEHNLFGWSRTMCKYGDLFLYLDIDDKIGIRSCIGLPPQEIERLEGEDETNPNYVQYQWNTASLTLENWQMAHFRVLGNDKHAPYGTSVLEPARRIWRQLTLLEDAMMAYRIVRSPERRVFYIDVGAIAPQDVEQYMQKVMTQMKRHQVVDPNTGKIDLRYNPLSIEEDYYIPVRGTTNTKIDTLTGGQFTGTVDDVKYLRDKLFSALKVPQSYLSMGEGASEDKTTLAQKDIRFARTIQRLQRVIISELEKIGIIHLFTLGFRGDDLLSFKLYLNNPSKIAELQEIEHFKSKLDVATAAGIENFFSKRWITEHILGISQDEYIRNEREMFYDKKIAAALEAVGQVPEGGELGGGGDLDLGGEGGDEFGGEMDLDLGGEEATPEDTEAAESEDDLLAEPPANKDEDKLKNRGPYKSHKIKYRKGGVKKQMKNMMTSGENGLTPRTRHLGKIGYGGLDSLARGSVFSEQTETLAELEEKKLFNMSGEINKLLEGLLQKEDKHEDETQ